MKRIALVITSIKMCVSEDFTKNGGNIVTKNLINELSQNKNVILDIYHWGNEDININGVNKTFAIQAVDLDAYLKKLDSIIEDKSYDLVLYVDIILPNKSLLIQSHSILYRLSLQENSFVRQILEFVKRKRISKEKETFCASDKKLFVVSKSLKEDYSKNFNIPEDNFVVVYPGTQISEIVEEVDCREIVFGISAGSNPNKGSVKFVLALYILKKKGYKFTAHMICPKFKQLYHLRFLIRVLQLGKNIKIFGVQNNMADFYNSIDCMVMPSMHEGFGLVALEAASNGVVPIVSSNCGIAELIEDKKNGYIFNINHSPIKNLSAIMSEVIQQFNDSKLYEIKENTKIFAKNHAWHEFANGIVEGL